MELLEKNRDDLNDWTQAVTTPTRHFWQYIPDPLTILTPSISKVLYPIEE